MDATTGAATQRTWLLRVEDWILAGWIALAAPALVQVQGTSTDVFDGGRPVDGLIGLIAVAGALACLALPRPATSADVAGLTATGPSGRSSAACSWLPSRAPPRWGWARPPCSCSPASSPSRPP